MKTIKLSKIKWNKTVFWLKRPISVKISLDMGVFEAVCKKIDVCGWGMTEKEAISDFCDDFDMAYNCSNPTVAYYKDKLVNIVKRIDFL